MTVDNIFMIGSLVCLGYCVFMAGAIWESNKSHKRFMKFLETSEINKWGEY